MAFEVIDPGEYTVGKALRADLFRKIKVDLDDLDARATALETGASKVEIFNADIAVGSFGTTVTGLVYHEALQAMTLSECAIQIYEKGSLTGTLSIDVKKNTTPNSTGMTSVFTSAPTIVYASSSDYQRNTGTFNVTHQTLAKGDILRFDITSMPVGLSRFRIVLIGSV
jgi:hypothetical protein